MAAVWAQGLGCAGTAVSEQSPPMAQHVMSRHIRLGAGRGSGRFWAGALVTSSTLGLQGLDTSLQLTRVSLLGFHTGPGWHRLATIGPHLCGEDRWFARWHAAGLRLSTLSRRTQVILPAHAAGRIARAMQLASTHALRRVPHP